jgi:hypothetical protein
MMEKEKRLIDANALLAELDKFANPMPNESGYEFLRGIATAITEIEDAPTVDAVEVVRCKDCKKSQKWKNAFGAEGLKCYLLCADIDPDDFCSYGERKDNG